MSFVTMVWDNHQTSAVEEAHKSRVVSLRRMSQHTITTGANMQTIYFDCYALCFHCHLPFPAKFNVPSQTTSTKDRR